VLRFLEILLLEPVTPDVLDRDADVRGVDTLAVPRLGVAIPELRVVVLREELPLEREDDLEDELDPELRLPP